MRKLKWFLRGFFWMRPAPYHDDFRQWSLGQGTFLSLGFLSIPVAIFAAGFYVGRL